MNHATRRARSMWLKTGLLAGAIALPLVAATDAHAIILSGVLTGGTAFTNGGTFVKLTPPLANPFGPPNSVGNDNFQSFNVFGFDEDQNIIIPNNLSAEVGANPVLAGTDVASHYVFFDPVGADVDALINFDANILAVMTSTQTLAASDFLANTGVNYLNPSARGLEPGDTVTISAPNQISIHWSAGTPGDYVRVLTEHSPGAEVPEPGTVAMLGGMAAAGGLGWLRLRRRRK